MVDIIDDAMDAGDHRRFMPEVEMDGEDQRDLGRLLSPRSIAIVGASGDRATIRGRILEYLRQRDYRGSLHLVSKTQARIAGRDTVPSLHDIGEPVDLVLIAVRAEAVGDILDECVEAGARFAICFSSGFAESGEQGVALQARLGAYAGRGLRLCGPNTAGFFNVRANIPATFARNVDAQRPARQSCRIGDGSVSIVAQSGGLAFAMSDRCAADHGVLANQIVSTGNEVDLDVLDFVDHLIDDQDTRVILLLVEAIKHAARLSAVAARARSANKPIVVAKFGRTVAGSRAVSSHAARLTGSDEAYSAAFRRHGIIRVDDEDSMVDLAAAFSLCPLPGGRRVGILTTSGGAGVWMADACESLNLEVPLLDAATQLALQDFVPSYGAIHNPVDLTAQVTVNPVDGNTKQSPIVGALSAIHDSPSIDAVVLVANMSDGDLLARERDGLIGLAQRMEKPILLYSHAPPSRASLDLVEEIGLVCLATTRRVAQVIGGMADYAAARARVESVPPTRMIAEEDRRLLGGGLCEFEAKALLKRHGIPVTEELLVNSAAAAAEAVSLIGAPVALKIQSHQIPHKTEIGGVILGVRDEAEARTGFETLIECARLHAPDAEIMGILVQRMVAPMRELAVGVTQDPDFGPMMMVGLGGIHIETLRDVVIEPLPVGRDVGLAMLRRLKAWPLLEGTRGEPPADVEAVVDLMERLSDLVVGAAGACHEIDLNPIFVGNLGQGAVVVDALVIGKGPNADMPRSPG